MSTITATSPVKYADISTQTLSFDEIVAEAVKEQQRENDKKLEELRPLCEELPPDALDPVTMEPFVKPLVTICSHTFDKETIVSTYGMKKLKRANGDPIISCPLCKRESSVLSMFYDRSFKGVIDHLKKIKGIFDTNVSTKQS